jgi:hypothetical protein
MSNVIRFPARPRAVVRDEPWFHYVLGDIASATDPNIRSKWQRRALRTFAEWNSWRHYGDGLPIWEGDLRGVLFEHMTRMSRAVITEPYGHHRDWQAWKAEAETLAASYGFVCAIPPHPLASIRLPGEAIFIVIARAGTVVNWLPEQRHGIANGGDTTE